MCVEMIAGQHVAILERGNKEWWLNGQMFWVGVGNTPEGLMFMPIGSLALWILPSLRTSELTILGYLFMSIKL